MHLNSSDNLNKNAQIQEILPGRGIYKDQTNQTVQSQVANNVTGNNDQNTS